MTFPGCGSSSGELEILTDLASSRHYIHHLPSWTEVVDAGGRLLYPHLFFKVFGVAGGIITLVTGASLASIFEIIYFLTVRLWEEGGKVSLGKILPR